MVKWKQYKLHEVLLTDFDGTWGEEASDANGATVLRSTDMRGGKLSFCNAARREIPSQVIKKKRLLDGDILVNKSSGSAHLVGTNVIFSPPDGRDYLCSNFIRCLRPDQTRVDPEFLYFGLQSSQFRLQVFGAQRTTSGLRNLKINEFKSGAISVPKSLAEQRRIVARIKECMERVEEIDKLRAGAIADSEKLQSAVFADYIESINDSDLGNTVLGDVITECKYGTSKKANTNGSGCPILRMGNIKFGRIDTSDLKYVDLPKTERNRYLLVDGDILINRTNSLELVGKSAVFLGLSGDWVYASYLIRLRVDLNKALPEYVNAVINSRIGRNYIFQTARRAIGMVNINAREIQRMPLPLPSIEEQAALIDKMNETEPLIDELLSFYKEDGLSHLRDSILRKAFAGEL